MDFKIAHQIWPPDQLFNPTMATKKSEEAPVICQMDIRLDLWNSPPRRIYSAEENPVDVQAGTQAQPSNWSMRPVYIGTLPDSQKYKDDTAELIAALDELQKNASITAFLAFSKRFKHRCYSPYPVAKSSNIQNSYISGDGALRRIYKHPFNESQTSDLILEKAADGSISSFSLITTNAIYFSKGKHNEPATLNIMRFDPETIDLTVRTPNGKSAAKSIIVPLEHAEKIFSAERAASSGSPSAFDYSDSSSNKLLIGEFTTYKPTRYIQYFNFKNSFMGENRFYPKNLLQDIDAEKKAELFGHSVLFKCDYVFPPKTTIKIYSQAGRNSGLASSLYCVADSEKGRAIDNASWVYPIQPAWLEGQEKRFNDANAFVQAGDFSNPLIGELFNAQTDWTNPSWMWLLGYVHCEPDSKYYNPIKGHQFYEHGVTLNSPHCAYNLGHAYKRGLDVDIDYEKAKIYLFRALDLAWPDAGVLLLDIFREDPRFKDKQDVEFHNDLKDIISRISAVPFGWTEFELGALQLNQNTNFYNPEKGIRNYKRSYIDVSPTSASWAAAFCLSARMYLGLETERNPFAALKPLEFASNRLINGEVPTTRPRAEFLTKIISEERSLADIAQAFRDNSRSLCKSYKRHMSQKANLRLWRNKRVRTLPFMIAMSSVFALCPAKTLDVSSAHPPEQRKINVITPLQSPSASKLQTIQQATAHQGSDNQVQPKEYLWVNVDRLNIRKSTHDHSIIAKIICGTSVQKISKAVDNLAEVVMPNNSRGYADTRFLSNSIPLKCVPL